MICGRLWNMATPFSNKTILTCADKANLQLDAQAKDTIYGSLSKDIFFRFHMLNTAKKIWDALNNDHVDLVARSDPHIQMLCAMFIGFRSLHKESVMESLID